MNWRIASLIVLFSVSTAHASFLDEMSRLFVQHLVSEEGCIDPEPFNLLLKDFLKDKKGRSPQFKTLCMYGGMEKPIDIIWSFHPTPEGLMRLRAGQHPSQVDPYDFWIVSVNASAVGQEIAGLENVTFEREGKVRYFRKNGDWEAKVEGISASLANDEIGLDVPSFVTSSIGISKIEALTSGEMTIKLTAPFFNIPVTIKSEKTRRRITEISIFGFTFKIKK